MTVRVQKRVIVIFIAVAIMVAIVPPHFWQSLQSNYLLNFMGLYLAGVFPSITLLVNSMTFNGDDPKEIKNLYDTIWNAIFNLFCGVGAALGAVIFLFLYMASTQCSWHPEVIERFFAAMIGGFLGLSVLFILFLPQRVFSVLRAKYEIAQKESKKAVQEKRIPF